MLKFLNKYSYSLKKRFLTKFFKVSFLLFSLYSVLVLSFGVYNNSGVIVFKALLAVSQNLNIEPPQLFGKIDGVDYKSSSGKAYILRNYNNTNQDFLKLEDFILSIDYPKAAIIMSSKNSFVNIQKKYILLQDNVVLKYGRSVTAFLEDAKVNLVENSISSSLPLVIRSDSYTLNANGFEKKDKDKMTFKGPFKITFN